MKLKSYGTILCQVYRESSPKPLANKLPSARREKERKEEEEKKAAFELENICNVSYSFYRSQELET